MVRWSGEYPGAIETAVASLVATFKKNREGGIREEYLRGEYQRISVESSDALASVLKVI